MASCGENFGGRGDVPNGFGPMEDALRQVWGRMEEAHASVRKKFPRLVISLMHKSQYDSMFTLKRDLSEVGAPCHNSCAQQRYGSSDSEFACRNASSASAGPSSSCWIPDAETVSLRGLQQVISNMQSTPAEQGSRQEPEVLGEVPPAAVQDPLAERQESLPQSDPTSEAERLCQEINYYTAKQYGSQCKPQKPLQLRRSFDYSASEGPLSSRDPPISVSQLLGLAVGPMSNPVPVEFPIIDFPPLESVVSNKQAIIPIKVKPHNRLPATVKSRPKPLNPFDVPQKVKGRGGLSMLSRGLEALSTGPYVPPQPSRGPPQVDMRSVFCRSSKIPGPRQQEGRNKRDKAAPEPPKKWYSDSEEEYPDRDSENDTQVELEVEKKVEKTESQLKRERKNLRKKKKHNGNGKRCAKFSAVADATSEKEEQGESEAVPEPEPGADPNSETYMKIEPDTEVGRESDVELEPDTEVELTAVESEAD